MISCPFLMQNKSSAEPAGTKTSSRSTFKVLSTHPPGDLPRTGGAGEGAAWQRLDGLDIAHVLSINSTTRSVAGRVVKLSKSHQLRALLNPRCSTDSFPRWQVRIVPPTDIALLLFCIRSVQSSPDCDQCPYICAADTQLRLSLHSLRTAACTLYGLWDASS